MLPEIKDVNNCAKGILTVTPRFVWLNFAVLHRTGLMMYYFDLFDIPVQLKPDKGQIRKKYLELSRRFHPDYFIQHNGEQQQEALENAAQLNKAYKVLSNDDTWYSSFSTSRICIRFMISSIPCATRPDPVTAILTFGMFKPK